MNRRNFVKNTLMFGATFQAATLVANEESPAKTNPAPAAAPAGAGSRLRLRPHHIVDIVTDHGDGSRFEPHPYGHSYHLVAAQILANLDAEIELVVAADAVCRGCRHLHADGQCDDVLSQLTPSPSKQAYNEVIDCRLLDHLELQPGTVTTVRRYLERLDQRFAGLLKICTHPKEDDQTRLKNLTAGLVKLGVRRPA